ncbi:MAG: ArsB/NhaD family transporter [Candidatus Omnitrophota bacterium]
MQMWISVAVFIGTYILISSEKVDKTISVILGVSLMFILGLVPFETAVKAIDLNVIFLLVGMMICVSLLAKTGFFEWMAVTVAKASKGEPLRILLLFLVVTTFFSAFLDNVTTILLLAPVTILIAQLLEISAIPFLILEAVASNIGGTATLIGDPPNIIIGSQAGLSFNDFLVHLGPVIVIIFSVFSLTVYFLFRKRWKIDDTIKMRVIEAIPRLAIVNKANMIRALAVLGVVFIGFFTHTLTNLKPGIIALCGGAVMMLFCRAEVDKIFKKIEWDVIFFFIGLFMLIAALEYNGVIEFAAGGLIKLAGNNFFLLCALILCGSALFSSIMDNIPFVITMVPMIKTLVLKIAVIQGIGEPALVHNLVAQPLWWSLALGACLGGNGTMIGASANVIAAKISVRNKCPITFGRFFKYGFPFMLQSLVISLIYIWVRYFVLQH